MGATLLGTLLSIVFLDEVAAHLLVDLPAPVLDVVELVTVDLDDASWIELAFALVARDDFLAELEDRLRRLLGFGLGLGLGLGLGFGFGFGFGRGRGRRIRVRLRGRRGRRGLRRRLGRRVGRRLLRRGRFGLEVFDELLLDVNLLFAVVVVDLVRAVGTDEGDGPGIGTSLVARLALDLWRADRTREIKYPQPWLSPSKTSTAMSSASSASRVAASLPRRGTVPPNG